MRSGGLGAASPGDAGSGWRPDGAEIATNGVGLGRLEECRLEVERLRGQVEQLEEAIRTRQAIGLATGLVAYRFECSPDRAWSIMVRVSQELNIKVRDVARAMVAAQGGSVGEDEAALLARLSAILPGPWSPEERRTLRGASEPPCRFPG
ncbi:MAG TPA: ANTAR domain-containing protein [Microlunatus sp.]|nr:ANTAR domain-containing protein [Microlunatus sp.]